MDQRHRWLPCCLLLALGGGGCYSPYYTDRGAVTGGLLGGGLGAVIGNRSGNSAEGALLGGAIGALTGAAVGSSLDEIDARNRALIAAQMGHAPPAGAVTIADVLAMSQSGVSEQLIITHIQANGAAAPPSAQDLIRLKQAGVADAVARALQAPPLTTPAQPPGVAGPPPPVVEPPCIGPWHRPFRYGCRHRHPWHPGLSFGVAFRN